MKKRIALSLLALCLAASVNAQVTTVATNVQNPIGTALKGSDLYVSAYDGNKIVKIDLTQPFPVTPSDVLTNITGKPTGLSIVGDYLYFNTEGNAPGIKSFRINLTNPSPTIENVLSNTVSDAQAYARVGDTLYISSATNGIFRVLLNQLFPQTGIQISTQQASGIALRGNDLYYGKYDGTTVFKINRQQVNSAPVTVVTGLNGPDGLTFSGNFLYVSEAAGSRIVRFDVTQANPTVETVVSGLANPTLTVFDGLSIYFGQSSSGNVSRLSVNALSFSPPAPVCVTESAALRTGGSPLGGTYSGPNVTNTGNGETFSFNAQAAGPGTYAVTYTYGALTSTASITVAPVPTVSATGTDITCAGLNNGQVATAASSGVSYLWSNGETTAGISNLATGVYTVTVSNVGGCTATAMATITAPTVLDINNLFSTSIGTAVVSSPYDNTGANATGDPSVDLAACFYQSDPLQHTLWFTFTGNGNSYRIRTVPGNAANYIQDGDTQAALYSGTCANPVFVVCNDDEDGTIGKLNISMEVNTIAGQEYRLLMDGYNGLQGQYCIEVTRTGNVAVTDISKTDIRLAPNPTTGLVQLSNVTAAEIQVFDYMGRMVKHMVEGGNSIDLSGQPAGLYILQIREQGKMYSARVVKE